MFLLSFCNLFVSSADKVSLSIWSCNSVAQLCNWSIIFQGVVIATHNKILVSVKFDSLRAKRNKWEWARSPSNIQCPRRVWSENKNMFTLRNAQLIILSLFCSHSRIFERKHIFLAQKRRISRIGAVNINTLITCIYIITLENIGSIPISGKNNPPPPPKMG